MAENTNRNVNDIIVEQIQKSFSNLMPEDEWRDLVAQTITKFKTPKKKQYGDGFDPSQLEAMVAKEIESRMLTQVKQILDSPSYNQKLSQFGHQAAPEVIRMLVTEHVDSALKNFVTLIAGQMVSSAVMSIDQRLQQLSQIR